MQYPAAANAPPRRPDAAHLRSGVSGPMTTRAARPSRRSLAGGEVSATTQEDAVAGQERRVAIERALGDVGIRGRDGDAPFAQLPAQLADVEPVLERRRMDREVDDQALHRLASAAGARAADAARPRRAGGSTTKPPASASSSAGTSRPAKKSIQTEVSTTTPLTRLLEVDVQLAAFP